MFVIRTPKTERVKFRTYSDEDEPPIEWGMLLGKQKEQFG